MDHSELSLHLELEEVDLFNNSMGDLTMADLFNHNMEDITMLNLHLVADIGAEPHKAKLTAVKMKINNNQLFLLNLVNVLQ